MCNSCYTIFTIARAIRCYDGDIIIITTLFDYIRGGVGKPVHIKSYLIDLSPRLAAPMSHTKPGRGVVGNIFFVLCFLTHKMSRRLVCLRIFSGVSYLMPYFVLERTCCTCVPMWYVKTTGKTHVPIIEPFIGVWCVLLCLCWRWYPSWIVGRY